LTFSCAHLDLAGSCGFYLFYVFPRFVVFGSPLPLFPLFFGGWALRFSYGVSSLAYPNMLGIKGFVVVVCLLLYFYPKIIFFINLPILFNFWAAATIPVKRRGNSIKVWTSAQLTYNISGLWIDINKHRGSFVKRVGWRGMGHL
jgi:hypothetical protein